MIHILAAIRMEPGNDRACRALDLRWTSTGTRPRDVLGQLGLRVVEALRDVAHGTARAGGDINGGAGATPQASKGTSGGAVGIVNRSAATAAGSSRQATFLAKRAIGAHGRALDPSLVIVFAGLYVEANSDKAGVADCIG